MAKYIYMSSDKCTDATYYLEYVFSDRSHVRLSFYVSGFLDKRSRKEGERNFTQTKR